MSVCVSRCVTRTYLTLPFLSASCMTTPQRQPRRRRKGKPSVGKSASVSAQGPSWLHSEAKKHFHGAVGAQKVKCFIRILKEIKFRDTVWLTSLLKEFCCGRECGSYKRLWRTARGNRRSEFGRLFEFCSFSDTQRAKGLVSKAHTCKTDDSKTGNSSNSSKEIILWNRNTYSKRRHYSLTEEKVFASSVTCRASDGLQTAVRSAQVVSVWRWRKQMALKINK